MNCMDTEEVDELFYSEACNLIKMILHFNRVTLEFSFSKMQSWSVLKRVALALNGNRNSQGTKKGENSQRHLCSKQAPLFHGGQVLPIQASGQLAFEQAVSEGTFLISGRGGNSFHFPIFSITKQVSKIPKSSNFPKYFMRKITFFNK